jgi:uncharacterized membrane protein YphA (DoxX/SURF4 family)
MEMDLFGYVRGFKATLRWPFVRREAGPAWLAIRLYLASVWLFFGIGKLLDGWLTQNPMGEMLAMIADPEISAAPFAFYRHVARGLLWAGADQVMSVTFPIFELGIALALLSGVMLLPAAVLAIFLNTNLILSGVADPAFDLRIITLQVGLLLAWRVAGETGAIALVRSLATRALRGRQRLPEHGFSTSNR